MKAHLGIATRFGVALLISLTVITAAATAFVVSNPRALPKDALSQLGAMGDPTPVAAASSADAASAGNYVADFFAESARSAFSDLAIVPERSLRDLLPNRLFAVDGGEPAPLAAGIVVGTVSRATGAMAYDSVTGEETPFEAENVSSRVIVVDIAVESTFGGASGGETVRVGVRVPGTIDGVTATQGLSDWGRVIVVFDPAGDFAFDATVTAARGGYLLVGRVSADGTISFPALGASEVDFLRGIETVDAAAEASTTPVVLGTITNGKLSSP
jgi:hypothetical protein